MIAACSGHGEAATAERELRVCADPNNLPFSNSSRQGFENEIAELLARDLHATVSYTWWAQRRGFIRNTLDAGECDVIAGIPASDEQVLTTAPYYRSTYVFVARRDRGFHIRSLDDPRLKHLRIGIHVIGDDYNALPPGVALARRGIIENVAGYSIYGDYSQPNPPARLIDAVADGDVDVAIAWGPLAGAVARDDSVPLEITPVTPAEESPAARFVYAISMGVRRGDTALRAELDAALARRHTEIERILRTAGVPLVQANGDVVIGPLRQVERTSAGREPCRGAARTRACD